MAISARDRKLLWGRSGNRCAKCKRLLVMPETHHDREAIVGQECHLRPQAADGPRGNGVVDEHVDAYSNLILLCAVCHTLVDEQPAAHPVELLLRMRQHHEAWVEASLHRSDDDSGYNLQGGGDLLTADWEDEEHLRSDLPSEILFSSRLADAFPGQSGIIELTDGPAFASRLAVLFREPIHQLFRDNAVTTRRVHPFWWFRGHENMYIDHFEVSPDGRCVLGIDELNLRRVVAYRRGYPSAWDFLYLEADADPASGVYAYDRSVEDRLEDSAYGYFVDEEYALWRGHRISRQEYDDGAAVIDGVPRRIEKAVVRRRFLTPYNLIVAGNRHVINENALDRPMLALLDGTLASTHSLEQLVGFVSALPKPARLHSAWD